MKNIVIRLTLLATVLTVLTAIGQAQTAPKAAGHWEGKIEIPDHELNVTVDLAKNATGKWIGSISIVSSTSIDIPLSTVDVNDTAIRFTAKFPEEASFEGHLSTDANSMSGKASNSEGSVDFHLTRNGEANVKLPTPSSPLTKDFEGNWEGTLEVGGKSLRLVLKLSADADGKAIGNMISVDQGNQEFSITTVTIKDKQLQLDIRAVSGSYSGTIGANGELAGEWKQGPNSLPLTFKRS